MPDRSLRLLRPGYRRWLTPDQSDVVFELLGFEAAELPGLHADVTVRDLDGEGETPLLEPIGRDPKHWALRLPKFHRAAELAVTVFRGKGGEKLASGKWRVVRQSAEALEGVAHFDGRGVFFHQRFGRWPLWWRTPSGTPAATAVKACKAAGLDGPTLAAADALALEADLDAANLRSVAVLDIAHAESQAKALRGAAALAGFRLDAAAANGMPDALAAIRRTNARVPCMLALPAGVAAPSAHEDAMVRPVSAAATPRGADDASLGRAWFCEVPPAADAMIRALAAGASGGFLALDAGQLSEPEAKRFIAQWRALERLVVRGVPGKLEAAGICHRVLDDEEFLAVVATDGPREVRREAVAGWLRSDGQAASATLTVPAGEARLDFRSATLAKAFAR